MQPDRRRSFAMLDVPPESVLFEKDGIFVVSTNALVPEHRAGSRKRK
jgi:hypothetical protein